MFRRIALIAAALVFLARSGWGMPPDAVYGWLFAPGEEVRFSVVGLTSGAYRLTWADPWTGRAVGRTRQRVEVGQGGVAELDASEALARLRREAASFPDESRLHRGHDVAFRLVRDDN